MFNNSIAIIKHSTYFCCYTPTDMERAVVKFKLNEKLYLRDPQETELGQKIIVQSIVLIDELGFEQFTFKKLAAAIESTEASVYRYFENKNRILNYLVSWYWVWLDYKIQFHTHNIPSPKEKLSLIIKIICETETNSLTASVDEKALYRIVVAESSKAYLIKEVDEINKDGLYLNYKRLNKNIAALILELNPGYKYPNALVSTMIETAHQQLFFSQHLPSLTNIPNEEKASKEKIQEYIEHLVWAVIGAK